MKKFFTVLVISVLSVLSASAQYEEGVFSVAGNLSYGSKIESLGVGLRGQYGFTDRLRGSAEYKYYIDRHNLSQWEINTDAHYVFGASETVFLYPLAGLNISRWTYDPGRSNVDGPKYSNSRLGVNLGFGGQVVVGEKSFIQVELKEQLLKDYTQFVASVGFMYQF